MRRWLGQTDVTIVEADFKQLWSTLAERLRDCDPALRQELTDERLRTEFGNWFRVESKAVESVPAGLANELVEYGRPLASDPEEQRRMRALVEDYFRLCEGLGFEVPKDVTELRGEIERQIDERGTN